MLGFYRFSSSEHAGYRFGFNGMEKDDEVKGNGNSLDFGARIQDPRLGRFFALDPLEREYPWNSPYTFSENRVIDGVELEGLEWKKCVIPSSEAKIKVQFSIHTKVLNTSSSKQEKIDEVMNLSASIIEREFCGETALRKNNKLLVL